ncbi:kelch-like protein 20 [Bolinopsis microptera]|uniref:kelch-like protein 20 n=1 Tax=Bolinopsis microptera TaxID=2820187 RepID=UPI003079A98B
MTEGNYEAMPLIVNDPGHASLALQAMDELRKKRCFCDVLIAVEECDISAHRLVLAASSSYFYAMFTNDLHESTSKKIEIKNVDSQTMQNLVNYAYTSQIEIRKDNVQVLLTAAGLLQFDKVQEICTDFIKRELTPSNCIGIYNYADRYGFVDLLRAADDFAKRNFVEMCLCDEFLSLDTGRLLQLVSSNELNVLVESKVYEGVMTWIRHSPEERAEHLPDLLAAVRLPLISSKYLVDHIEKEELIAESENCRVLVEAAKNHHILPEHSSGLNQVLPRHAYDSEGLYVFGGYHRTVLRTGEMYDANTDVWRELPMMECQRYGPGSARLEGLLYVAGGHDSCFHLASVECFNPRSMEWTKAAPMLDQRFGVALGELNGWLYAVGGRDSKERHSSVECYDATLDSWKYVNKMSFPRSGVGIGVLNGALHSVGGYDGHSDLASVERYDPRIGEWHCVYPMTHARTLCGVAVLNSALYVVGGRCGNTKLATVECYEPRTNTWSLVEPLTVPRDGHGLGALNGRLYAVGGKTDTTKLEVVECYDPVLDSWSMVTPMFDKRNIVTLAVI